MKFGFPFSDLIVDLKIQPPYNLDSATGTPVGMSTVVGDLQKEITLRTDCFFSSYG